MTQFPTLNKGDGQNVIQSGVKWHGCHFDDKNVWNIFERTQCGPKGGGKESRNNQGVGGVAFFAPLFWPNKKGARTPVRKMLRSKESQGV